MGWAYSGLLADWAPWDEPFTGWGLREQAIVVGAGVVVIAIAGVVLRARDQIRESFGGRRLMILGAAVVVTAATAVAVTLLVTDEDDSDSNRVTTVTNSRSTSIRDSLEERDKLVERWGWDDQECAQVVMERSRVSASAARSRCMTAKREYADCLEVWNGSGREREMCE